MSTIYMRFVIMYRNQPRARELVEKWVLASAEQGAQFHAQNYDAPFVQTRTAWPNLAQSYNIPLGIQCEEVEIVDGKLISLRLLVIDVESVHVSSTIEQLNLNI